MWEKSGRVHGKKRYTGLGTCSCAQIFVSPIPFLWNARLHVSTLASETPLFNTTKFYSTSHTLPKKVSSSTSSIAIYPQLLGVPAIMSSAGSHQGVPTYLPKTAVFFDLQHQGLATCLTHGTERQPPLRHLAFAGTA